MFVTFAKVRQKRERKTARTASNYEGIKLWTTWLSASTFGSGNNYSFIKSGKHIGSLLSFFAVELVLFTMRIFLQSMKIIICSSFFLLHNLVDIFRNLIMFYDWAGICNRGTFHAQQKSIYQLKNLMPQYTYVDHKYAAVPSISGNRCQIYSQTASPFPNSKAIFDYLIAVQW